jgi:hypothetical protein
MSEHPVNQPIQALELYLDNGTDVISVAAGFNGITRIEACTKSGMHSEIPYVRVWADDVCISEYCQHHIIGVYFAKDEK